MDAIKAIYSEKGLGTNKLYAPIVNTQGQAFASGINGIFQDVDFDSPDWYMREVLKRNTWHFSVAKNYNDNIAINNALIDENGALRSWNDFKREAQKVAGDSIKYLKTEYNTVVAGAQMSRLWNDIQRDKEIIPLAQFVVVKDGRTSDICSPLDGVIVSVDDPMLAYFFPPNHFNCRTTVKRLRRGTITDKYELPDIPEAFRNNVGATGKVFTDDNAYIKNTPDEVLALSSNYYSENLNKEFRNASLEVRRKLEVWKQQNPAYYKIGDIDVSLFADKSGFERDLQVAQQIYDAFKIDIKIRPYQNPMIMKGVPNPEYLINGKFSDRKSPTKGTFTSLLQKAKEQACTNIVFDLEKYPYTLESFIKKLKSNLQADDAYPLIEDFYIIYNDKVLYYSRAQIKKATF